MGLHLNYELRLPGSTSSNEADALLEQLRVATRKQRFDSLSRIVALRSRNARNGWFKTLETWASVIARPYEDDLPPLLGDVSTARAFFTNPGRGCETASFGFLRRADEHGGNQEWFWHCCCKTQYASLLGDEHLLKCHRGLVALLDRAIELGLGVVVRDETHYWETRDESVLLSEVAKMNEIVARFAGAFNDAVEEQAPETLKVDAPIFKHPRFERLEMGEES